MNAARPLGIRRLYSQAEETPGRRWVRIGLTVLTALGALVSLAVEPVPWPFLLAYVILGIVVGGLTLVEAFVSSWLALLLFAYGVGAAARRLEHDPTTGWWQPYLIAFAVWLLVDLGADLIRGRGAQDPAGRPL